MGHRPPGTSAQSVLGNFIQRSDHGPETLLRTPRWPPLKQVYALADKPTDEIKNARMLCRWQSTNYGSVNFLVQIVSTLILCCHCYRLSFRRLFIQYLRNVLHRPTQSAKPVKERKSRDLLGALPDCVV